MLRTHDGLRRGARVSKRDRGSLRCTVCALPRRPCASRRMASRHVRGRRRLHLFRAPRGIHWAGRFPSAHRRGSRAARSRRARLAGGTRENSRVARSRRAERRSWGAFCIFSRPTLRSEPWPLPSRSRVSSDAGYRRSGRMRQMPRRLPGTSVERSVRGAGRHLVRELPPGGCGRARLLDLPLQRGLGLRAAHRLRLDGRRRVELGWPRSPRGSHWIERGERFRCDLRCLPSHAALRPRSRNAHRWAYRSVVRLHRGRTEGRVRLSEPGLHGDVPCAWGCTAVANVGPRSGGQDGMQRLPSFSTRRPRCRRLFDLPSGGRRPRFGPRRRPSSHEWQSRSRRRERHVRGMPRARKRPLADLGGAHRTCRTQKRACGAL